MEGVTTLRDVRYSLAYYIDQKGIIRGIIAVGLEQILRLLVAGAITALLDET
jgi:hypothetical protein